MIAGVAKADDESWGLTMTFLDTRSEKMKKSLKLKRLIMGPMSQPTICMVTL